jgi:hypothetical protein
MNRNLAALLFGLTLLASCDGGSAGGPPSWTVPLTFPDPVTEYRLLVTDNAGILHDLCCPGADALVACDLDQLSVDQTLTGPLEVLLLANGHQPLSELITPLALEEGSAALAPLALPAAQKTADYFTGSATGDTDSFLEYAVPTPGSLGRSYSLKFQVAGLDTDSPTVYFQHTARHPLHHPFAQQILGVAMDQLAYWQATYVGQQRPRAAGTVTWYPDLTLADGPTAPFTLTFFPRDDLQPALMVRLHHLVTARLGALSVCSATKGLYYHPAGSLQEAAAQAQQPLLTAQATPFVTSAQLYGAITFQAMNQGLWYGRLVLSPEDPAGLPLSFKDILVLGQSPVNIPLVGGTITDGFQTPLSHVNVAAKARGTPNLALPGALADPAITALEGKLVRFEVKAGSWSLTAATQKEAQDFWDSLNHQATIPAASLTERELVSFEDLHFDDANFAGRKAANLGELRRLFPAGSPEGFAVPFAFYDDFVRGAGTISIAACTLAEADCLAEDRLPAVCSPARVFCEALDGGSFQDFIDAMLEDADFASDTALREAILNDLRWLMRNAPVDPTFAAALDARAQEIFGTEKLRLRSSTNAEDLDGFTGAGLYDSVGAFASGADAASLEVRKVFASLWNFRAFEERAFWGIDHQKVKMAVAASRAYPGEAANGVLLTRNPTDPTTEGMYVNVQLGETPVTNPEGGALPEVLVIVPAPASSIQVRRLAFSSLSPETPVLTDQQVTDLFVAASKAQSRFSSLYKKAPGALTLDLEFKYLAPDNRLVIKQARPY